MEAIKLSLMMKGMWDSEGRGNVEDDSLVSELQN